MSQHFASYPGSTFACGADAVGARNSRQDADPRATTCMACLATDAWRAADARAAAAAVPLFVAVVVIPDEMDLPSAVFGPFDAVEDAVAAGTDYARQMIAAGKWEDVVEDLEDVQVIAQPLYSSAAHLFTVEAGK